MSFLVYGDATRNTTTPDALAELAASISALTAMPAGLERHAALVCALIEAGELAQGLADAAAQAAGHDEISCTEQASMRLVMALAQALGRSFETAFTEADLAPIPAAMRRVEQVSGPEWLTLKQPEGFAFYALYPEGHFAAARALRGRGAWRAIGIRSIGTTLSAMVAAGFDAPPPLTVRPVGHPFHRTILAGPKLSGRLCGGDDNIALVDEGPGFSGSSFGALADFLEVGGVSRGRLHIFPGHSGDLGQQASAEHRARWAQIPRHCVSFEELWLTEADPRHLRNWAADLVGAADGPLQDISGGAWRVRSLHGPSAWPASHLGQERRKFLMRTGGKTWLLKFSGLGREGSRKLRIGKALAEAGFTPHIAGLRHGFLVQEWLEDAEPVDLLHVDQTAFLERVAGYLAFRARHFPAEAQGGSIAELFEMARFNAQQVFPGAARSLGCWQAELPALAASVRAVAVDGRMHAHEWVETSGGDWLKTDALDHHAAHDLVGCQDIAWDIAGAAVEFGLCRTQIEALRASVEHSSGRAVSPDLVRFYGLAYLAFQLGRSTLAAASLGGVPEEQARLQTEADRYAERLRAMLLREQII